MAGDSSHQLAAPLASPSTSQLQNRLSIDGFADVINMKVHNPPDSSVTPVAVVQNPNARTQSLQTDIAIPIEHKSTLHTHAYSRVGVIKPGTYSRTLLKTATRHKYQNLVCAGCTAVHSLGIDHCHKHDYDKNGKGSNKRLRR
jgi:hypothetical protein